MTPTETAALLRQLNEWRRGGDIDPPGPLEVGKAIDAAIEMIERLEAAEKSDAESLAMYRKARDERDALRAKIEAMEKQEPVAWMLNCPTLGGDTGWILSWTQSGAGLCNRLSGEENEKKLYALPGAQAQPAPSVPECPYPCGWQNLLKYAIEDGAYLARSLNEDEPVTENARVVAMRMVLRLRDVLMAINNAAPEAKP